MRPWASVGFTLGTLALDQGSKYLIRKHAELGVPEPWLSWGDFKLQGWYLNNKGMAFGLGHHWAWAPSVLLVFTVILSSLLTWYVVRAFETMSDWERAAWSLLISGAWGNAVDRLTCGVVTDFIDVSWLGYHWPAFNLADTWLCLGALLLVCQQSPRAAKPSDRQA